MIMKNLIKGIVVFISSVFLSTILMAQGTPKVTPTETKKVKPATDSIDENTGWRVRDFRPYVKAVKDLERLNTEYSENMLKLARDEFSTGLDILEDMESEIVKMKSLNKKKKYLNERWYWQEIDRRNQEYRRIAKKKFKAKMKSVTYFTKSINYLDQIKSLDVTKKPEFIEFQSKLYQIYVSTQYDLNNFKPCIPILERYVTLSDKNQKDSWAYKYLASCYGYMEAVLAKYKQSTEDEITNYKNKKNRSMLKAAELKYSIDSPHYKQLREVVELDQKKSLKINNN